MNSRPIRDTGISISPIGLGGGNWGREIDEESSYRVMDYAVENGITLFDTSEIYGGGQSRITRKRLYDVDDVRETTGEMSSSEKIIGRWMRARGCRDRITISTKIASGGSAENIPRALSGCLERLGTDHVEILKLHSPDADTPMAETLDALGAEVDAGRVGVFGCANHSAPQLQEALDAASAGGRRRYEIVQLPYGLAQPGAEEKLLPLCEREELTVAAYSPLGAGFLTGKYTPDRSQFPSGSRYDIMPGHANVYFTERNFKILDLLREKAKEIGISMIRLALAWAMTHPAVTSVLIGARNPEHIDNALAAFEMGMDPQLRSEMSSWTREPED